MRPKKLACRGEELSTSDGPEPTLAFVMEEPVAIGTTKETVAVGIET